MHRLAAPPRNNHAPVWFEPAFPRLCRPENTHWWGFEQPRGSASVGGHQYQPQVRHKGFVQYSNQDAIFGGGHQRRPNLTNLVGHNHSGGFQPTNKFQWHERSLGQLENRWQPIPFKGKGQWHEQSYTVPSRVKTSNLDFGFVVVTLSYLCRAKQQLLHFTADLPNAIDKNVDQVLNNISVVRPDEYLRSTLQDIGLIFKQDIQQTIVNHCSQVITDLERSLTWANPLDKDKAGMVVSNRLKRSNKRISHQNLKVWIEQGLSLIGTGVQDENFPPLRPVVNTAVPSGVTRPELPRVDRSGQQPVAQPATRLNEVSGVSVKDTVTLKPKRALTVNLPREEPTPGCSRGNVTIPPTLTEGANNMILVCGKGKRQRSHSDSPGINLSNRFDALSNDQGTVDTPKKVRKILSQPVPVRSMDSPVEMRSTETSPAGPPSAAVDAATETVSDKAVTGPLSQPGLNCSDSDKGPSPNRRRKGAIIHKGDDSKPKNKWVIETGPNTKTVIIGDSNMSKAQCSDPEVEIHAYPGMNLMSLLTVIRNTTTLDPALRTVVVAVGVNNRGMNFDKLTLYNVRQLGLMATRLEGRGIRFLFTGVSVGSNHSFSRVEVNNINRVNAEAEDEFGVQWFIPPLPSSEIRCERDGLHHTTDSVSKVVASILDRLTHLN